MSGTTGACSPGITWTGRYRRIGVSRDVNLTQEMQRRPGPHDHRHELWHVVQAIQPLFRISLTWRFQMWTAPNCGRPCRRTISADGRETPRNLTCGTTPNTGRPVVGCSSRVFVVGFRGGDGAFMTHRTWVHPATCRSNFGSVQISQARSLLTVCLSFLRPPIHHLPKHYDASIMPSW